MLRPDVTYASRALLSGLRQRPPIIVKREPQPEQPKRKPTQEVEPPCTSR
jgi:hypothetical protein